MINFSDWYVWLASHRIRALREFGEIFERAAKAELEAFAAAVHAKADRLSDEAAKADLYEWESDRHHLYDVELSSLGGEAVVTRAFFILEAELISVCRHLARKGARTFTAPRGRSAMQHALDDLARQDIRLCATETRDLDALRRLRNAIAHQDSVLRPGDLEALEASRFRSHIRLEGRKIIIEHPVHTVATDFVEAVLAHVAAQLPNGDAA